MRIYHYDGLTKKYQGFSKAVPSPKEPGVFLISANATTLVPLDYDNGVEDLCFIEGAWVKVPIPVPEPEIIPEPTTEQIIAFFTCAVQNMLDTKARERNYDGILSACTYATSTIAKFRNEGQACVEWRDAVWMACYSYMANVQAGAQQQLNLEDFLAALPTLTWPS